jgi:uncharacterized protein YceH (UPF0502 family)
MQEAAARTSTGLLDRITALETEVAELRGQVESLRQRLDVT